jgi:RNA polymerase sigma-70 factor (ECF subfamily)
MLPRLRRFARTLAGNAVDADDLVQTAVTRALERLHQLDPRLGVEGWLFRIVRTVWIDECRRRRVRGPSVELRPGSVTIDGAATLEHRLMLAKTREAVAALGEDQRVLIDLIVVDGRTYREAAEILGLPIGTVMSRLARARRALHETVTGVERRQQRVGT